uniref:Isochorismatase domain-containing protein 2, mitochondrial n=1 Tax=Callorhinchus milii TaxID=7868 RepID=V9LFH9_CALMI
MAARVLGRFTQKSTVLFLCDLQEKFRDQIVYFPQIVAASAKMLKVAEILQMPVIVTEQYPKGLGATVPELGANHLPKYPKTCFSMVTPDVEGALRSFEGVQSVLLCGIETHACIMSTALDLLDRGLDVHVVADACSSRTQTDRVIALSRLRQSGAFVTTSETCALQLLRGASHPNFKEIQKIIREPTAESDLRFIP